MNKLTFIVKIESSNPITRGEDILTLADNITIALKSEADGYGLIPDAVEGYTTKVTVTHEETKQEVTKIFAE